MNHRGPEIPRSGLKTEVFESLQSFEVNALKWEGTMMVVGAIVHREARNTEGLENCEWIT
jgi:hypothetical protein